MALIRSHDAFRFVFGEPEQMAELLRCSLPPAVAAGLLHHPRGQDVIVALFSWYLAGVPAGEHVLRTVMARIDDTELRGTMKSALDELLEEGFAKGLAKGREEGREEGREQGLLSGQRQLLRLQVLARFGPVSPAVEARLAALTKPELDVLATRLFYAASLADLLPTCGPEIGS